MIELVLYLLRYFIGIIIIPLIITSAIIHLKMKNKTSSYFLNGALMAFDILLLFMINSIDYINEVMRITNAANILFSVVLLVFTAIYLINMVLKLKTRKKELNLVFSGSFIIIILFFIICFSPTKDIIDVPIKELDIAQPGKDHIDIYETENIERLLGILNNHTYNIGILNIMKGHVDQEKTVSISLVPSPMNDREFSIHIHDKKSVNIKVDGQLYKAKDEEKLLQEVIALIDDFEKNPERVEELVQISTNRNTYRVPFVNINITIANNSYKDININKAVIIEQYEKDQWEAVALKYDNSSFQNNYDAYQVLHSKSKFSYSIPLSAMNEALKPGRYRIFKTIYDSKEKFNTICEFNLE